MAEVGRDTRMDVEQLNRLRWQRHRGWLEPDLVPGRFAEKCGDRLQGGRPSSFQTLPTISEDERWGLIRARQRVPRHALRRAGAVDEQLPRPYRFTRLNQLQRR